MTRNRLTLDEKRKPWYKEKSNIIIIVLIGIGSVMIIGSQIYSSTTKDILVNQQLLLDATNAIKSGFGNLTDRVEQDIALRTEANEKIDETNNLIGNLTERVVITNSLIQNLTITLKDPHRFDTVVITLKEAMNNMTIQHREMMRAIQNLTG